MLNVILNREKNIVFVAYSKSFCYVFVQFGLNAGDSVQKDKLKADERERKESLQKTNNSISDDTNDRSRQPTPIDWTPQENCYFCVDGKLLTVNDKGDLVAESGSVNTEPELANRVSNRFDSFKFLLESS